jgi:amidohydrolase
MNLARPAIRAALAAVGLVATVLAVTQAGGTSQAHAEASVPRPDFAALAAEHGEEATADRSWLHQHAELSLREFETQSWVRAKLEAIPGVELVPGEWGTGLVAILRGSRPGPLVGYRADIDGLPITETTGLPYACTRTDTLGERTVGVMHACGHDIHTAVLLGTARVLSAVRASLPGSVLFIIEPAEEIGAGSALLLEAGLFENGHRPEAIFALHDHPTIMYGQVGYCPGRSAANVDDFFIHVVGRGGHGAYPHKAIDPVVIASKIVLELQTIVSREIDPARQAVVTVGSIHGGTTSNVIPEEVTLHGTVRSLEPEVRAQLEAAIPRTVRGVAAASGAPDPEIRYALGTPSMYNDPDLVAETLPTLKRVMGEENIVRYDPAMGGEDFSRYQALVPGFMFRLGVGRPDRPMTIHSPSFDPDERAVPLGIRLMSEVLWDHLERRAEAP